MLARARGSAYEVQTQLEVSRNLGFLAEPAFGTLIEQANEVGRLINGLIRTLKRQIHDAETPPS
jgi:four helix bundle protein